ncbi:hypothetical protein D3C86_1788420 [compost metagenome]
MRSRSGKGSVQWRMAWSACSTAVRAMVAATAAARASALAGADGLGELAVSAGADGRSATLPSASKALFIGAPGRGCGGHCI